MNKSEPLYSDAEFFGSQLNLKFPGMETVAEFAVAGRYMEARKAYAGYIRSHLQPQRFFCIPYDGPGNCIVLDGESESETADRICHNYLVSCGIPYNFGRTVDWHFNATPDEYPEWTWQLNRHNEWKLLAHMYQETGNERYAAKCADFFTSWVQQACNNKTMSNGQSLCWRSIECGIRMGINWPYALHAFYKSPAFTDDVLVDWVKSVCEHGHLLHDNHKQGNWLIMEMNGLAQISIIFPELSFSDEWRKFSFNMLEMELRRQFYPDGFQYELSTNYHEVVLLNYCQLLRIAMSYNIAIQKNFLPLLERAVEVNIKLMMPDGRLPDINDGCSDKVADLILPKMPLFTHREDFKWIVSYGKEGVEPEYTSVALPYSGIMVMRSGWKFDAIWALLDAGPFGRAHQHEDKLNILFSAHGKLLVSEGGNYAYDGSEIRKYVLSTRSHNTVRVDGHDQNRYANYRWEEQNIDKLSDMKYEINDYFDFAEGIYTEGYTDLENDRIVHRRSVYFLKKSVKGIKPFLLIIDRMTSGQEHIYETLWHLTGEKPTVSEGVLNTEGLRILYSDAVRRISIVYGQTVPEWQGWIADTVRQGDYRPVYTLQCFSSGNRIREVTVLDPFAQFEKVCASENPDKTDIMLTLSDGRLINFNESDFFSEKI